MNWFLVVVAVLFFFIFLGLSMKHKHPIRSAVGSMILGGGSLLLSSFILKSMGITLGINIFTSLLSLSLGIPGTLLVTLLAVII